MSKAIDKGNSSIPVLKSHKAIKGQQIRLTHQNRGNTHLDFSTLREKQRNTMNTKVKQKETSTHMETKYLITNLLLYDNIKTISLKYYVTHKHTHEHT